MKYSVAHQELQKVFNFPSENYKSCSIDNPDDYKKIVCGPAYKDFSPRTIPGLKKENIESALCWLAEEIHKYITDSGTSSFSVWHSTTCDDFCEKLKKCHGAIPYGKAQKIINMSFKYLFCLNDSQKYASKFKDCHMAIDLYTLEWFIRNVLANDDKSSISVGRIRETSWSKLEYGKSEQDEYTYLWLQGKIKAYLNSDNNTVYYDENGNKLDPFFAEFYIWREMRMHLAMETLYSQSGENIQEFKTKSISDKITALKELLDKIELSVKA